MLAIVVFFGSYICTLTSSMLSGLVIPYQLRTESDKRSSPAVGFKDGNQFVVLVIKLKFRLLFLEKSRLHRSLKLEQLNFA